MENHFREGREEENEKRERGEEKCERRDEERKPWMEGRQAFHLFLIKLQSFTSTKESGEK